MTHLLRTLALLLLLTRLAQAVDVVAPRVLEITSESRKLAATVEFLETKDSELTLKTQVTASKSFDWLDIPDKATAARIKIGELATLPIDLAPSGTTLVEVGTPTVTQNDKGLSIAILGTTVKKDFPHNATADATGVVFFGHLNVPKSGPPPTAAELEALSYNSLYLVLPPKQGLDVNNPGTKALVEKNAQGVLLRADFPLVLRKYQGGNVSRSADDPIIRAGQYVLVSTIHPPDPNGNVYAEVKVMRPPGGN